MLKNVERAKALAATWLRKDEDFSTEVYPDPGDGSPRIGYGSACPDGMTECDWLTAERMMQSELEYCAQEVYVYLGPNMVPNFNAHRLAVLYCMVYQMGYNGLCNFKKFGRAITKKNYEQAADEMVDSKWHGQTPERCERLALIFLRGSE